MPNPPNSGRPAPRGTLGPLGRGILRAAASLALLALLLLVLDIGLGLRLPQPIRPALPIVLAVGLAVALAVGIGAYGAPRKPDAPAGEPPAEADQRNDAPTPP